MRDRVAIAPGPIGTKQEPAGEALSEVMFRVATGKLRGLGKLCLHIA